MPFHETMDGLTPAVQEGTKPQWFVMRDLKRSNARQPAYRMLEGMGIESNARQPAYRMLEGMGIEVFTPMVWRLSVKQGKRIREQAPFMQDLLFVHDTRRNIDPVVERAGTLQYRYVRGGYRMPMTVRDTDMDRFIRAVRSAENPCYYTPDEISADMIGKKVRIIGGALDGYEGHLQKMQGSRVKRLFIELSGILAASVEVQPEYVQPV